MKFSRSKKFKQEVIDNYFDDSSIKESMAISRKAALNWIEEANHFFYKANPRNWRKQTALMKKIGW
jgi:hypothetical protein